MEKKQLISVVKPLIAAALLFGSSGGVAWGQAYIGGASGVQNIFGAGESARLNGGSVAFPGGGTWSGSEIQIATDVGNIVINTYNGGGRYNDYTNVWTYQHTRNANYTTPSHCTDNRPSSITPGDASPWVGKTAHLSGTWCGATFSPLSVGTSDPYTTHQFGGIDDGVPLVQITTSTNPVINDATFAARGNPPRNGAGLVQYRRPTTVAIDGNTTINEITIGNLRWYYRYHGVTQTSQGYHQCITYDHHNCTWSGTSPTTYHVTEDRRFLQYEHKVHGWSSHDELGTNYLDAGVLILRGAKVCVDNDITDQTDAAQSPFSTSSTEGVLIWPETGNFVLRARHLNKISMAHKDNPGNSDHNNPYFTDTQFTSLSVQNSSGNMYLYKSDGTSFPFLNTANLPATGHGYTNIPDLYASTQASILGLRGNYHQDNAFVHTTGASDADKHGVIEVGSTTTGQQLFKVYSGGVIKNYSTTDCHAVAQGSTSALVMCLRSYLTG